MDAVQVGVVNESGCGERRVALVPAVVPQLLSSGVGVVVERGAGTAAQLSDDEYVDAGATVVASDELYEADVIVSLRKPSRRSIGKLRNGQVVIGFLEPGLDPELIAELADLGVTAIAMELVPRISRAQAMDALSSQALVAGYRCALVAAERLPRFFPMFMTAAGTTRPATVVVLGAGVAGLQAIATARRLGAVVEAYDVRESSAEEIRSLGARYIDLSLEALEGAGGYAREMTDDRAQRQRELLAPHVARADALITTAAVPGRPAPRLVSREMIAAMRPGSVVVDLAAEQGGNVEGSRPGEELNLDGVVVWGGGNVPSQLPEPASQLYAQNVVNVLGLMVTDGVVELDFDDEIIQSICVTHEGEVRRP